MFGRAVVWKGRTQAHGSGNGNIKQQRQRRQRQPGFHSPVKTEERKWENDRPIGRWVEGGFWDCGREAACLGIGVIVRTWCARAAGVLVAKKKHKGFRTTDGGDAGKWPWGGRAGGGITMNGTASSRWSSRGFRMSPVRNGKTRCLLRYEAKDASEK
ncbi:hypothetical protein ZHAS_00021067 [Anopheles sinensis]|uniref:Uncharacterized protein n=1 Tax=Anopheles sinensis TaxID=74873 RepID=A0A084WRB3_ANOSI|nr:hypothetical protein ZHAS_00021067 [Anopheles sinensis]